LKDADGGRKEVQNQGEEKQSCSDDEKSKENTDVEREPSTETGNALHQ
jgi:hypothetical protein